MKRIKTKIAELSNDTAKTHLLLQDEQADEIVINGINLRFSTFLRLGLKSAIVVGSSIKQSLFEDVYARKAKFSNVDFTGTIFRNCNFEMASFQSCNFRYCYFHDCLIPHEDIISCLPTEPNIRKELAINLKTNFENLGKKAISDTFLDIEIQSELQELKEIIRSKTSYHKQKFDFLDRLTAIKNFVKIKISGLLWGYGHRVIKLLVSYIVVILFFTLTVHLSKCYFQINDQTRYLNLLESFEFVFASTTGYNLIQASPSSFFSKLLAHITNFIGLLYLGLLAATLYRKIAR